MKLFEAIMNLNFWIIFSSVASITAVVVVWFYVSVIQELDKDPYWDEKN